MPPTWLTADEIAQRLGRPVSTIRSWRNRYRPFVPERLDARGRQTYPLERLQEIAEMRGRNLTPREIDAELARHHGSQSEEDGAPVTLGQVLAELRELRQDIRWLVEREKARGE